MRARNMPYVKNHELVIVRLQVIDSSLKYSRNEM